MSKLKDFRIAKSEISALILPMVLGETAGNRATPILVVREHGQLILEICHFTQDLNPVWETRRTLQTLKSLSRPIVCETQQLLGEQERFESLVASFFDELRFSIMTPPATLSAFFLPDALAKRKGPAPLMMLLFCTLCEEAGIRVQVSSCRKRHLLKVQLDGRSTIVDFADRCRPLEPHEIVDLINRGFDFSSGCLNSDSLVVEYLNEMATLARESKKLQILSLVHSYLMKYQPFNLKHLSERAAVAYETGDYKTAIDDIRSYFQYKPSEFTNLNLKKIYKVALKKKRQLER